MRAHVVGTRVAAGGTACHRRLDRHTRHTPRSVPVCQRPRGSSHVARKGTHSVVTCPAERALARSDSAAPRLSCLSTLGIAQRAWQPRRLVHAAATSPRRGTSHRRRSLTRSSHCACHGVGRMAVCVCTASAVVVVYSSDFERQ